MFRSPLLLAFALATACTAEPAVRTLTLAEAVQGSAATAGVKLSELNEVAARAGVTIARSDLLTQLNAEGSVRRGTNLSPTGSGEQPEAFGPNNYFDGRLRLGQALIDVAAWYRTDAAGKNVQASLADSQVSLEVAAQQATNGYILLLRARALTEVRRRDLGLAEELATLAEAQVKAGVAEPINATRSQTQVAIARGDLLVEENRAAQTQIDLARALSLDSGLQVNATTPFDASLVATQAPSEPDAAIALALRDRPELHALSAARLSAELQARAIQGERFGNAQLFADYGTGGPSWSRTEQSWTIGASYTVPIFDGLRREGRLDAQQATIRQNQVRSTDLKDQIAAEVRAAIINLNSSIALFSVAQERVRLAEKELSQARDRFRVGVASNLDVIAAQQGLSRASEQEVNARAVGQATELR